MGKKFLVTGGAGFIGKALVSALVFRGNRVRVLDDFSRHDNQSTLSCEEKVEVFSGNIRDISCVRKAMQGVDAVIHLAAINGTEFFYTMPDVVLEVATKGMLNVLDTCVDQKIREIYTASSSEVYHIPESIPTPESVALVIPDPFNPRYSYSGGKLISELLTINYGRKYFDKAILFRPHNVYGPNMGTKHVIPQFIEKINQQRSSGLKKLNLAIQGTGEETRSFIYIDDFVEGFLRMMDYGQHQNIYHIGNEQEISIRDLAIHIGELMDVEVQVEGSELAEGSPLRRCPDTSKLRALGYEQKDSLKSGLKKTIEWYLNN